MPLMQNFFRLSSLSLEDCVLALLLGSTEYVVGRAGVKLAERG